MTIQSGRPSSRSSQRSSGSIGSYGNSSGRRTSGAPKGIAVSSSRQGSARSAAILLLGGHIQAIRESDSDNINRCRNSEAMLRYIELQIEEQKRLLYSEIPALRDHEGLMRKLRLNLKSEAELSANNFYRKIEATFVDPKKLFSTDNDKNTTITITENPLTNVYDKSNSECSGLPNTEDSNFNGSSASRLHMDRNGGFHNPTYSNEDFDTNSDDEHGSYIYYNQDYNHEIIIGALPTPASESAEIAVN